MTLYPTTFMACPPQLPALAFDHGLDLFFERRQLVFDDVPDNLGMNTRILVDENIT
jgi:hypothetical protein